MRTVSDNSEADIARHEALILVESGLRELTANLLRIIRGAGKPHEIMHQMVDLAEAIQTYQAAVGSPPWDQFVRALDVSRDIKTMQPGVPKIGLGTMPNIRSFRGYYRLWPPVWSAN